MATPRSLLSTGTGKTGLSTHHFSIPAVRSCPGRSSVCESKCYARRGRFLHRNVQAKLRWAFEQSKRDDFVDRMCGELYRKGILACRWFVSGDVYSPAMALKMTEIVSRSEFCRFWLYSRSWRIPTIEPLLRAMAVLPNMVVHYSCDSETGMPDVVPDQVRVAWMSTEDDEVPSGEGIDLLFRTHKLRKERVPLHLLDVTCPQEVPGGKSVTCATCQWCIRKD
jgi:hypothetical protein